MWQEIANLLPLILLVGGFFFLILLVRCTLFFRDFSRQLRYINLEIYRTSGKEQEYWLACRRRLWLSLIPWIGKKYR